MNADEERNQEEREQRLHELLCAYVLGELEGDQRAEIEAQLAGSPDLCAERERIEATIHLVREAFPAGESLPADKAAALSAAAGAAHAASPGPVGPRAGAWFQTPLFRMAATVTFLTLGYAAFRSMMVEPERPHADDAVAKNESAYEGGAGWKEGTEDRGERSLEASAVDRDGLGVPSPDSMSTSSTGTDRRDEQDALGKRASEVMKELSGAADDLEERSKQLAEGREGEAAAALFARAEVKTAQDEEFVAELEALDKLQDAGLAGVTSGQEAQRQQGDASAAGKPSAGFFYDDKNRLGDNRVQIPEAEKDPSAGLVLHVGGKDQNGVQDLTGEAIKILASGEITVGEIRADAPAPASPGSARSAPGSPGSPAGPAGPGSPGPATRRVAGSSGAPAGGGGGHGGGSYRGPGDTLPPSEAVPETITARIRATTPATGGGADGTGSSDFFLGQGERKSTSADDEQLAALVGAEVEVIRGLRGLGYLGGDEGTFGALFDGRSKSLGGFEVRHYGRHDDPCAPRSWRGQRLTPEQREALIRLECARLLQCCRPRPHEHPRDMFFRFWGDNPFEITALDKQSTFSVDVDTASYALARRYLREGNVPTKAQIRTEEFLNYFEPDLPAPAEGTFAIHTEIAPSRFSSDNTARWMLRVGLRGKDVSKEERRDLHLTFVVDTSGSMKENNRMELVKHALRLLLSELGANDQIAIVAFSREARLVLPMTSAAQRGVIEAAIFGLNPDGGTNAEAGLLMGYQLAGQHRSPMANDRVVLLSDGVANIGNTDQNRIAEAVKVHRENDVYLNTVGVGMNNHNDVFLEQLANKGDGLCNYIDSAEEARRALVENFTGAFEPIARNVKIQVEFDPQAVYRYRLLGYENRAIADQDFRNDAVDAGEVNAGHQVVALYELELATTNAEVALGKVFVRWLNPDGGPLERGAAHEIEKPFGLDSGTGWEGASAGYRRSVLVAQFAEFLRRSTHARGDSVDALIAECLNLAKELQDPDFDELCVLVQMSKNLVLSRLPQYDELYRTLDAVRYNHYLHGQYERFGHKDLAAIKDLEQKNQELEDLIKQMVKQQIEDQSK